MRQWKLRKSSLQSCECFVTLICKLVASGKPVHRAIEAISITIYRCTRLPDEPKMPGRPCALDLLEEKCNDCM